jgi:PAS domain S-box-containing protein
MRGQNKPRKQHTTELKKLRHRMIEAGQLETTRKQAEEALQESENYYRTLVQNLPQKIFLKDKNSVYLSCNENFSGDLKMRPAEIAGKTDYDFYPKELAEKYRADDKRIMESGKTEDIEEGYIQDGKEVIVHTVKTPVKDEKGKALGILGIFWDISKGKHADDELKKYRERLEELVEERTAELRNANEQLQREITERKRAEKALRKSEERYRSILENIQDGYFEVDLTGNFTFVNGVICKRLGYSRQELIGMNNRQYTDETTAQKTYQLYNRVYRTGEPVRSFEEETIRKDGTREIYELSVSLIRDSEGKPIGFRGISRDITERKRAEEALRESEEKYRTILESIQEGYFEVDLAGNCTFANDARCRSLGYTKEELIGMNNRQFEDKENAKKVYQAFNRVYRTGEPVRSFDEEVIRKDGTKAFSELSVSLIRDSEGKPIGFRGISRDITERKRAGEALRRSEERATQLSRENAIMAEIGRIVSSTLKIEEVYKRFAEEARELIPFDRISINTINPDRTSITIAYFFGVKIEESEEGLVLPLDRPFFEYILNRQSGFLIHPQDESELTEHFPNFVRHFRVGIRTMIAVPLISKDQAIGILHIQSLKPNAYTESDVRLAERVGNQIAGAIANAQLFTARQRAEEELRKAHEMLEKRVEERTAELSKANELLKQEIAEREQMQEKLLISERLATLGLFSGSISHELKNPLSTIDSSVYYLKTKLKDADEKVRTHLDRIKSSVGSSLAIIDSLRNLTQIKEPRLQRTDLKSVILDAIANAEVPETVNVIRNITEQEVLVNADPEQLKMAFKNIVKNAIQAMDGKGTLEVTVGKIDDQVEVSFTDTGLGIASENLHKIFQPLFSTKAKGLGFGLSISKMIIDKHSGTIQAKSEPGKGATILIRLSLNTQS